ncbi:MAG TPA: YigZ family protein [Oligoflexus sp.]|uniref:IMPACT family protein n=1 Tax=Oligoflexus sp. TaxID=1971216 RepID=UPI002D2B42D6|nr:YigZ family protein [Oligoflexus sp.]HYX37957.1 YigZ family protein [Oligoflexus sp.]
MPQRVLLRSHRIELIEKHSRFIGIGFPCQSLDAFKRHKADLEKEFPDASHITFTYKFFEQGQLQQRVSDDGEPSGTAGKPILMHIDGQNLINLVLFVVRYFGGIKLGAGGLVRAYGNTAKQFILEAPLEEHVPMVNLEVTLPYSEQNRLDYLARKHKVVIVDREFGENLRACLELPEAEKNGFLDNITPYLKK